MSPRNIILLVAAAFIAIGVSVAVKTRTQPVEKSAPVAVERESSRVLVAKKDIRAGSFVRAEQDLEWKALPESLVSSSSIREGSEDVKNFDGAVARNTVRAGEAITGGVLIRPGAGGFLSAVLEPGKRAVSIAVSATSGTAGLIFPGDRVDLIVTHQVKTKQTSSTEELQGVVSETFVENVRVVAVDQMLDNPENKAILAKTVTVEVSPEQAQKVSVAVEMGKISLALRSLATDGDKAETGKPEDFVSTIENAPVPAKPFTSDGDVSVVLDRNNDARPRILVIRGKESEVREFYQDGQ